MDLTVIKRRAEMLDMVCKNFHPAFAVSQLALKYHVSEGILWNDWSRRKKWVPIILALAQYSGFAETMESKVNAVEKAAWMIFHSGDNDSAKVGALNVVLKSLNTYNNTVVSSLTLSRLEHLESELAKKKEMEEKKDENQQTSNQTIRGS